jgi:hypothetical protein
MLTTSFTNGLYKFTDGEFISLSVSMDNLYLPMVNWLTIGNDGTDGQCFGGLPYAFALMLNTSFTNGLYKFTDGEFISPSIPMDNLYLPMVNWLTIGNGEHSLFTDGIFIFPSVRVDTYGRNNFTKLTVGMLATVLDNPRWILGAKDPTSQRSWLIG